MRFHPRLPMAIVLVSFLGFVCLGPSPSSAQLTTASITGTVRDQTGAPLPGATIVVTNQDTGRPRTTLTNERGTFRLDALEPGVYSVQADLHGFTSLTRRDIVLTGTAVSTVGLTMQVVGLEETVTVTAEAPLVDLIQNQVKTGIDSAAIENLPINGRRFQDFAFLAPGVHIDFGSTTSGGTDAIAFFGFNERVKSLYLDGVDLNDELTSGGTGLTDAPRAQLSMESIESMEILRNQFSAEVGRQQAGVINVISKSGTNEIHGRAFSFFRNDLFDKTNYFATGKVPFRQFQGGGNIGGPIVKDKTHFFFGYERWDSETVTTFKLPETLLSFLPDTRSEIPQTNVRDNFFTKLSHSFSSSHFLNVSYLYDQQVGDGFTAAGNSAPDATFLEEQDDHFLVGRLTSSFGSSAVNELRLAYSRSFTDRPLPAGDMGRAQLVFPGLTSGTPSNMPQARTQTNYILMDVFSRQASWKGDHSFKLGGEVNVVRYPSSLATFQFGEFRFARAQPPGPGNRPIQYRITDYNFIVSERNSNFYGLFIQDDWRVSSRLTLNLGVRYDLETYSGSYSGEDYPPFNGFEEGVRFLISSLPGGVNESTIYKAQDVDRNNIQPRVGFNYAATEDGLTSVRGGFGIFTEGGHDPISVTASLRKDRAVTYLALGSQFDLLSFFPNRPPPELLSRFPQLSVSTSSLPGAFVTSSFARHLTLGIERQLPGEMAVGVDFAAIRSRENARTVNVNHPDASGACPFITSCSPVVINISDGQLNSDVLQLQLRRRFDGDVGFLVSYTYLKARQDGPSTSPFLRDEDYGPTPNDVPHHLVASVNTRLPGDIDLSVIANAASAFPYNVTAGTDTTGDRLAGSDRPPGVGYNSERADGFFTMDLRIGKSFPLGGRYSLDVMWEMFNLFNTVNFNNYVGAINSPFFGQPTSALSPFQGQLGARFSF